MIEIRIHNEIPEALNAFSARFTGVMVDSVNEVRDRIASRAVTLYMREAGRERSGSGRFLTRSPSDSGPLRILSGRLAGSILGEKLGSNSGDTIYDLTVLATEVRLRWGSRTPYALIQEKGGVAGRGAVIPPRPYIKPATNSVIPEIPEIFDTRIQALAAEVGL